MKPFATSLERLSQMRRSFVDLACVSVVLLFGSCAYGQQTLSLHQAIEEGLRSPAAQVYQGQADQTSALIKQANLRPNPRLYLQSEDLRPWDSNFSMADNSESYIFAGQTVEIARKRGKRLDFAKANASRAEATAALLRHELSARIAYADWRCAAAN